MTQILQTISLYKGTGILFWMYIGALIWILWKEKDRRTKLILGWLPFCFLLLFLNPLFCRIYSKVEGAETYYRILWLLPMGMTVSYAAMQLGKKHFRIFLCIATLLIILGGKFIYTNPLITRAENRLHLPRYVVDVCDYIVSASGGSRNIQTAVPGEFVHYVRQYTTDIRLAYGREMMVAHWGFANPVYEAMEVPEEICAEQLVSALKENECRFVVLSAARKIDRDLTEFGYEKQVLLDGYYIYMDPAFPPLY